MDWIVLRKLLAGLVLPPAGPLFCVLLGLALMRRYRRLGKTLAWFGACLLFALTLPIVSTYLVDAAGGAQALDLTRPVAAQAIVISGAGVRIDAPEFGGDTLATLTLERTRYGAFLARKTGLPLLVTGGVLSRGTPEAELMRDALQQEFATPARWVEAKSRNTSQNARFSAAMLLPQGITRIALVTHAFDTRRARLEYEAAGFEVIPAPTGGAPRTPQPRTIRDFLPSASALQRSHYACYELLALAVRSVIAL